MAEQVVIEFAADTTKLQPAIDFLVKINQLSEKDAAAFKSAFEQTNAAIKQSTQQSISQVQKLSQEFKNLKGNAAAGVMLDQSQGVINTTKSIVSLREQIKQATALTAELAAKFGELDSRTIAAAKNAANLKERFSDAQKQIAALNPEAKFTAFSQLGGVLAGAFQAATGALQAFGVESETATKLAQQFQGAINIAAGLNQLTGLKDALTNVKAALGLTTTAATAAAVANETLATAEGAAAVGAEGAAVATNTFTASLLANPVVLAIAAIAALAGAYVLLSDDVDDAAKSLDNLNDKIKEGIDFQNINKRVADETAESLRGQIDILKAQGASKGEILKKELELNEVQERNARRQRILNESEIQSLEEQAVALAKDTNLKADEYKKQSDAIAKRVQDLKESNKELTAEEGRFRNDSKAKQAQYNSDLTEEQKKQIEKEAQLNAERLKEKRDLEYKLREIGISLIADEFEQRRQRLALDFDKEIDLYADKLQQKKITLEEFNKIFQALSKKNAEDTAEITRQGNIKAFADEETLRKQQTDNIIKIIQDQNTVLQTEDIEALNDRIKAKQEALRAAGVDELTIAKETNKLLGEETKKLQDKQLNDELQALIDQRDAVARNGGDIVALENLIAKKRLEISKNLNDQLLSDEERRRLKLEEGQKLVQENAIQTAQEVLRITSEIYNNLADEQIADIERVKNAQLAAFDEQIAANKKEYDARNIGSKQFSKNEEELLKKKQEAEAKARREEAAIRRKQFEIARTEKLLQVAIATATGIVNVWSEWAKYPPVAAALTALMAGVGAAQTAAILSQPTPKYYFKGTPSLQSSTAPQGIDTIPVMANRGEAIIPTNTTEEYRQAIDAIYYRRVPADYMNRLASGYGKHGSPTVNVSGMNIDYDKLGHALAFHMRGKKGVYIENWEDAATLFGNNTSPYRR